MRESNPKSLPRQFCLRNIPSQEFSTCNLEHDRLLGWMEEQKYIITNPVGNINRLQNKYWLVNGFDFLVAYFWQILADIVQCQ